MSHAAVAAAAERQLRAALVREIEGEGKLIELDAIVKTTRIRRGPECSLVINGLDSCVDEEAVTKTCLRHGTVLDVRVARVGLAPVVPKANARQGTLVGRPLHCAIVDFKTPQEAAAAASALDGASLWGSVVSCKLAVEGSSSQLAAGHLNRIASAAAAEAADRVVEAKAEAAGKQDTVRPAVGASAEAEAEAAAAAEAEDALEQLELAHTMGRPLHAREMVLPGPTLAPAGAAEDGVSARLAKVKAAMASAQQDFDRGHYKHMSEAIQQLQQRSAREPLQRAPGGAGGDDDPAAALAPTAVASLTARPAKTKPRTPRLAAQPAPPSAARPPRPESLLSVLAKRHQRLGITKKMASGGMWSELEKDVKETVAITSELQRRSPEALAPPPRKPLSDSVMALISRYSPSQGFADGDEPESEPGDFELADEVVDIVLALWEMEQELTEQRAALDARKQALAAARKSAADHKAAMEADKAKAEREREEMAQLAAEVRKTEAELSEVRKREQQKARLDAQVEKEQAALDGSNSRLAELRAERDAAKEEEAELEKTIEHAEATAEAARLKMEQLSEEVTQAEQELAEIAAAESHRSRLASEVADAEAELQATNERLAALKADQSSGRAEDARLASEIANAEAIAEAGRLKAEKLKRELAEAEAEIAARQDEVEKELAKLKPIVDTAQAAVSGIKTKQLDEMRAMLKPPVGVRMTMEAVMILLGKGKAEWSEIRKEVQQKTFINDVLSLDANTVTKRSIELLKKSYTNNEVFIPEKIARASKAAAPLCSWARAQVKYAEALRMTRPLTDEVSRLRKALEAQRAAYEAAMAEVQLGSPEGLAKLKEEIAAVQKRLDELDEEIPPLESAAAEQSSGLETLQASEAEAVTRLESLRPRDTVHAAFEALQQEMASVNLGSPEELAKLHAKREEVSESVEDLEGQISPLEAKATKQLAALTASQAKQADAAAKLESLRPSDVVQPELEELQSKLLQKVWANMDRDGNGVLDQGEMLGVLVVVQGADFEDEFDFEEVFEEVDADGSGSIEYEEFQSWFMGNYRERLVEIGSKGLGDDGDEQMTQYEALLHVAETMEAEIKELEQAIKELEERKRSTEEEELKPLLPGVPTLDGHDAQSSVNLILALPEWCREPQPAVLDWFAKLLPSVPRERLAPEYESDAKPEEPDSTDDEAELLEGWVPVGSLVAAWNEVTLEEAEALTVETCVRGMPVRVAERGELRALWKECEALPAWSREGAVFAGKTGHVASVSFENDGTVYFKCPAMGMVEALAGVADTEEEDAEEGAEEDDDEEEDEDTGEDSEEPDGEGESDDAALEATAEDAWSTAEAAEWEAKYDAELAAEAEAEAAGEEALAEMEHRMLVQQQHEEALELKQKAAYERDAEEFADAVATLDAALELWPENAEIVSQREEAAKLEKIHSSLAKAKRQLARGRPSLAVDTLEHARMRYPDSEELVAAEDAAKKKYKASLLKKIGLREMGNGNYQAASKALGKALILDPEDPDLADLQKEVAAVASHTDKVGLSFQKLQVRRWFSTLKAEVAARKREKREREEAQAAEAAKARLEAQERAALAAMRRKEEKERADALAAAAARMKAEAEAEEEKRKQEVAAAVAEQQKAEMRALRSKEAAAAEERKRNKKKQKEREQRRKAKTEVPYIVPPYAYVFYLRAEIVCAVCPAG